MCCYSEVKWIGYYWSTDNQTPLHKDILPFNVHLQTEVSHLKQLKQCVLTSTPAPVKKASATTSLPHIAVSHFSAPTPESNWNTAQIWSAVAIYHWMISTCAATNLLSRSFSFKQTGLILYLHTLHYINQSHRLGFIKSNTGDIITLLICYKYSMSECSLT